MKSSCQGIIWGVGVGPGDPELITVKALRVMRGCQVIAFPGVSADSSLALRIAGEALPGIVQKDLLPLPAPMTRDETVLQAAHEKAAGLLAAQADAGHDVAYLTLGDPSLYCSFTYLQQILEPRGYQTRLVSGVPSFCAASALLGEALVTGNEDVRILTADALLAAPDAFNDLGKTCVVLKAGKRLAEVCDLLCERGYQVSAAMNCGLDGERVCQGREQIPATSGYFTIVVARRRG